MSVADVYNEMSKTSVYKKDKPVTQEQYLEAVDNLFNKKFPIIPNARKEDKKVDKKK